MQNLFHSMAWWFLYLLIEIEQEQHNLIKASKQDKSQ